MVWKLKAFLAQERITPNALATHVKGQLSKTAIYNLVQEEPPTSIHLATLNVLIPALSKMTGQNILVSSLLEYQTSPQSWKDYSGAVNLGSKPKSDKT